MQNRKWDHPALWIANPSLEQFISGELLDESVYNEDEDRGRSLFDPSSEARISTSPATPGKHNLPTLAAVGFLAYYIVSMWHEVVGHGLANYLYGARHFVLTSTSIGSPDPDRGLPGASRIISAAGSLSTILLGLVLYPLVRRSFRHKTNPVLRLFLWLVSAVGLFHGLSYVAFSGMANVGDWKAVIAGWPHQGLLRLLEILFGGATCAWVVRVFARLFGNFAENLTPLALVPYFAGAFGFCLAGFLLPHAAYLFAISVIPASLIGQGILVFVAPVARRIAPATTQRDVVPFSATALILAAVFVVILLLTAPGIPFTLPPTH